MRLVDVAELKAGQKLAKTVYDESGRPLLFKGNELKEAYIARLANLGIPFVYIEDELVGPIEIEDVIHDQIRIESVKTVYNVVEKAKVSKDIDLRQVNAVVNKILDDLKSAPNLMVHLQDIRNQKTHLYSHSVAVSVLSLLTGMVLGFDEMKLRVLGIGSLLHDIGKSIDEGPEHSTIGFNILRKYKEVSTLISHMAFQHHERYDGQGFPRNLKKEEILIYAAIVSIANYYDNLVAPFKGERMLPYQALEKVVAESGRAFHPELVKAFSRNIAPYPSGTLVKLSDGSKGVVISVPRNYPTRPTVKIILDHVGIMPKDFPEIELMKNNTLFVNEILSEKDRENLGNASN